MKQRIYNTSKHLSIFIFLSRLTLRVRSLHSGGGSDLNVGLLQLGIEVTELPLHLVTTANLVDELALEGIHIGVQL